MARTKNQKWAENEELAIEILNSSPQKLLVAISALYYFNYRNKLLSNQGQNYKSLGGKMFFDRKSKMLRFVSATKEMIDNRPFGVDIPQDDTPLLVYPYANKHMFTYAASIHLEVLEKTGNKAEGQIQKFSLRNASHSFYTNFLNKISTGKPVDERYNEDLDKVALYCDYDSMVIFEKHKIINSLNKSLLTNIRSSITKKTDNEEFDENTKKMFSEFIKSGRNHICYLSLLALLHKLGFNVDNFLNKPDDSKLSNRRNEYVNMASHFIPKGTLEDIEFTQSKNLKITIITSNLKWAPLHLDLLRNSVLESGNHYRYLLMRWDEDEIDENIEDLKKLKKELEGIAKSTANYSSDKTNIKNYGENIELLLIKNKFLTLYFENDNLLNNLSSNPYSKVQPKTHKGLSDAYTLGTGGLLHPFDFVIFDNITNTDPFKGKYMKFVGGKPKKPRFICVMELNPIIVSRGDNTEEFDLDYFDTFVPIDMATKIKKWAEFVWMLYDIEIAPKTSKHRKEFFKLED